mgnify:CR=1 FL=1
MTVPGEFEANRFPAGFDGHRFPFQDTSTQGIDADSEGPGPAMQGSAEAPSEGGRGP